MISFEMRSPKQSKDALVKSEIGGMTPLSRQVWCGIELNAPPGIFEPAIKTTAPYNAYTLRCAKALARMNTQSRYTLVNLQKQKVRPHILLAIYHLIKVIITGPKDPYHKLNAEVFGAQVLEKFSQYHHTALHTLAHELSGAFHLLYQAGSAITIETRQAALSAYRELHEKLSKKFGFLLKRHAAEFYNTFHPNHRYHYRHQSKAWQLASERMTNSLRRALHYTHKIAEGLFVVDIAIAMYDSANIIATDPNWFPDLTHEIMDVESFFTVSFAVDGLIAILAPSPAGWVAMIVTGILTVLTHRELMHKVLTPYLDYINRSYHARY